MALGLLIRSDSLAVSDASNIMEWIYGKACIDGACGLHRTSGYVRERRRNGCRYRGDGTRGWFVSDALDRCRSPKDLLRVQMRYTRSWADRI
jgi:hypothetical protein